MAVRLSSAALFAAALLPLVGSVSTGPAKPPDLPQIDRPVCAPQCPNAPDMTNPGMNPVLPQSLLVEGGQEESEIRTTANRHAAARRVARCLLLGTHPLLPFLPIQEAIDEALEDVQELGPDDIDPGMVAPADRLIYGIGQTSEKALTPAIDALMQMLNELQSLVPAMAANDQVVAQHISSLKVEVQVLDPGVPQAAANEPTSPYIRQCQPVCSPPTVTATSGQPVGNTPNVAWVDDLLRQAEAYRAFGQLTKAEACYQKVCECYPGSRHAARAAERLAEVQALMKLVGDQDAARQARVSKPRKTKVAKKPPVGAPLPMPQPVFESEPSPPRLRLRPRTQPALISRNRPPKLRRRRP